MTAFALGYRGRVPGGVWYLSRASSLGNLMRTSDPFHARTWPTVAEAEIWFLNLPERVKDEIQGRGMVVIPLTLTPGQAIASDWLKPAEEERTR